MTTAPSSFAPGAAALVTGASRGIGREFVRQLLESGTFATVLACSRSAQQDADLRQWSAASPALRLLDMDVADEASIRAAATGAARQVERLHLVVNCAGVLHDARIPMRPERRLADLRPEALHRAFAVNAVGPLLVARHFEPLLAHREHAVFASLSARVGSIADNRLGGWYAYRASKAAQNQFLRTLAIEWARSCRNVVCVALHPGTTDTELSKPFQARVPADRLFTTERCVRQLLAVIERLGPRDSGRFLGWDGAEIPW